MKACKRMIWALLFPHPFFWLLLIPLSAVGLIAAFTNDTLSPIFSYFAYALSAYTLTSICARSPRILRAVRRAKQENRLLSHYFGDPHLRIKLSLYGSLSGNAAYAALQLGMGIYHRSFWFCSLAGYYLLLALTRFFLLRYSRSYHPGENPLGELRRYRFCGGILLALNLALSVILLLMIRDGRGFVHHPITTIALAAYTFTTLTFSILHLWQYRTYKSPLLSAACAIRFAAALVSVITLESAMLSAFGEASGEQFRRTMTALTGGGVVLIILGMAVFILIHTSKQLKIQKD